MKLCPARNVKNRCFVEQIIDRNDRSGVESNSSGGSSYMICNKNRRADWPPRNQNRAASCSPEIATGRERKTKPKACSRQVEEDELFGKTRKGNMWSDRWHEFDA